MIMNIFLRDKQNASHILVNVFYRSELKIKSHL
jgi:hypothetical protein